MTTTSARISPPSPDVSGGGGAVSSQRPWERGSFCIEVAPGDRTFYPGARAVADSIVVPGPPKAEPGTSTGKRSTRRASFVSRFRLSAEPVLGRAFARPGGFGRNDRTVGPSFPLAKVVALAFLASAGQESGTVQRVRSAGLL
jgi:hypothetical protein